METNKQLKEELRNLDDGNFFDTGSDGNLYFHTEKVADWWLAKLDQALKSQREEIKKAIENLAKKEGVLEAD